jgi:hypothetical protein
MAGLIANIHSLADEDVAFLGPGAGTVCGWSDCEGEPRWQVEIEDLITSADAGAVFDGAAGTAQSAESPRNMGLVSCHKHRYYCDQHARQFCLQENIDLPLMLQKAR